MSYQVPLHIPQTDDPAYYGYTSGFAGGATPDGFSSTTPYAGGQNLPALYQQQAPQQSGGLLANLPLKDIKSFIDRMGGLEGITSAVAKMQKLFTTFQSITPMLKLLVGSFGSKAATTSERNKLERRMIRNRRRVRRRANSYAAGRKKRPAVRKSARSRKPPRYR